MNNSEKRIYFRAFEFSDLEFINRLRNDEDLYEFTCGNKYYTSSERDKEWISDKISNNYTQLYFMLCLRETNLPIGYICATNIDYVNRKAQWGGILISTQYSGKGYGTESGKLLIRHLFCELGMNMVYGYWLAEHEASLRMGNNIGFRLGGVVRDFVYKNGKYHAAQILTILKSEFDGVSPEK